MNSLHPVEAVPTPDHDDNPLDVRQAAASIKSRAGVIERALGGAAALPETRRRAKDDLIVLACEALALSRLV